MKVPCFFLFLQLKQNNNNMGRGDKRTRKGKISSGSFGKMRLARRTKKKAATAEKTA